jgi:hypothetical protein
MKTATVTRRSKIGYGYNSSCEEAWNENCSASWLRPISPTRPDHVGTPKTIFEKMDNDRTLKSFDSGGTVYAEKWFIKVGQVWKKVRDTCFTEKISMLYEYNLDTIEVDIE